LLLFHTTTYFVINYNTRDSSGILTHITMLVFVASA